MPRFSGKFETPELNLSDFTKALYKKLENEYKAGAREFIQAAIPLIPVQSGMARGSYLNIGRLLGMTITINKKRYRYKRNKKTGVVYRTIQDRWYYPPGGGPRIPKTPESGAKLTSFKLANIPQDTAFAFDSRVFHYTLEDLLGVRSPSAPWRSLEAGRLAFLRHMDGIEDRLPKIGEYTTKTVISFGYGARHITKVKPTRSRLDESNG